MKTSYPSTHTSRPAHIGHLGALIASLWVSTTLLVGFAEHAAAQPMEEAPLLEDTPTPDPSTNQDPKETPKPNTNNGGMMIAEFGLEERNVVLSAAKTRTTIQEAPAIVTVITAQEIQSRGYRTLNDVLQSLPGFEGDRWDSNGWTEESFARGNPRGLLILWNGVNIVDPIRNTLSLDRKIPLEAIQRIEIVSGPGGVLWGSNALLGIVNIIPKTGADLQGVHVAVGGGSGPGELGAFKTFASAGGEFLDGKLKLFGHASFFTTRSAELTPDSQKVIGVLPPPTNDGTSLFLPGATTTNPSREYFFNFIGSASYKDLSLELMIPFESDTRQLATGGAVLTEDYRTDPSGFVFPVESQAQDDITLASLSYQTRFAEESFGLALKTFFVKWTLNEDPFGAFPPSSLSNATQYGVFTRLVENGSGTYRYGLNLDMDLFLPHEHHLIFGAEFMRDIHDGTESTTPIDRPTYDNLTPEQQTNATFEGPSDNPAILFSELITLPTTRTIGAIYARDEWKASNTIALSGGARLQLSDSYDPTVLFSAASVVNLAEDTFLKLNYSEGFRPPNFQSTDGNNGSVSNIRFEANPDLGLESSRAGDVEINTILFKGGKTINRLYLRADYSLSQLDDVIIVQSGRFINSGTRLINSFEALARLELRGDHELQASYYFVDVQDSDSGHVRNIANHIINVTAKANVYKDHLELTAHLTRIGAREDLNRSVDPSRDPTVPPFIPVRPTDITVDTIEPTYLLRVGTRIKNIYDRFNLDIFGHNVLNQQWYDPDLFFDDRIMTRPFPKPRWSVFAQLEARFE